MIKKMLITAAIIALLLCFTVIFFMNKTITTLKAEKAQQAQQIGTLTAISKTNQATIEKLKQNNIDNQNALIELRQKDEQTQTQLTNQTNYFMGLLNENKTLKNWADTPLPADVISLFSRTKNSNGSQNH